MDKLELRKSGKNLMLGAVFHATINRTVYSPHTSLSISYIIYRHVDITGSGCQGNKYQMRDLSQLGSWTGISSLVLEKGKIVYFT